MENELLALEEKFEKAEAVQDKQAVLSTMLSRFPLLFGYWLKLIEISADPAAEWSRAVSECPTIDLWIEYLKTSYGESIEAAQAAVDKLGYHFHAYALWEALIERSNNDPATIIKSLDRPLYAYAQLFQTAYEHEVESAENLEQMSARVSASVTKRWEFESELQRPYFHPHEVEDSELETWDKYLDYVEEASTELEDVKQLYERCLITTALYPKYWLRYLVWLDKNSISDETAYLNALHYHPNNRTLRLLFSRFLELAGEKDKAREQLLHVEKSSLADLVAFDRRNGIEKRTDDTKYLMELAKQTGDMSLIPIDQVNNASELFQSEQIDPKQLFDLWKRGSCPDPANYAARLRACGYLDMFFTVDATLGYHE